MNKDYAYISNVILNQYNNMLYYFEQFSNFLPLEYKENAESTIEKFKDIGNKLAVIDEIDIEIKDVEIDILK